GPKLLATGRAHPRLGHGAKGLVVIGEPPLVDVIARTFFFQREGLLWATWQWALPYIIIKHDPPLAQAVRLVWLRRGDGENGGSSDRMKAIARDVIETIVLTALIFLVVQSVVKNFKVEGSSMEPTLHDGEFLLVDKAVYWSLPPALV